MSHFYLLQALLVVEVATVDGRGRGRGMPCCVTCHRIRRGPCVPFHTRPGTFPSAFVSMSAHGAVNFGKPVHPEAHALCKREVQSAISLQFCTRLAHQSRPKPVDDVLRRATIAALNLIIYLLGNCINRALFSSIEVGAAVRLNSCTCVL